jgi:hypothetical protein
VRRRLNVVCGPGGESNRNQDKEAVAVLPFHEVAELFPLLEGPAFEDLKADIRANGLREPVWTYQGKIIDGRNRARACEALGIEPATREWDGQGSLVAFVVSLNLHRRHLSSSQRAAVAAEMLPLLEAEAKERQRRHGGTAPGRRAGQGESLPQLSAGVKGEARQVAAEVAGTNRQYVSQAKRLLAEAPDLFEEVKRGKLKVTQATDRLKRRQAQQRPKQPPDSAPTVGPDPTGQLLLFALVLSERRRTPRPNPLVRAQRAVGLLSRAQRAAFRAWFTEQVEG